MRLGCSRASSDRHGCCSLSVAHRVSRNLRLRSVDYDSKLLWLHRSLVVVINYPLLLILSMALVSMVAATAVGSLAVRAGFPLPMSDKRIGCVDGLRGYLALAVLVPSLRDLDAGHSIWRGLGSSDDQRTQQLWRRWRCAIFHDDRLGILSENFGGLSKNVLVCDLYDPYISNNPTRDGVRCACNLHHRGDGQVPILV